MLRLDINLVFTIINLLVLYFLMKKFLFKPVNNIIAQREEAIKKQFDDADEAQKKADDLKKQYEVPSQMQKRILLNLFRKQERKQE